MEVRGENTFKLSDDDGHSAMITHEGVFCYKKTFFIVVHSKRGPLVLRTAQKMFGNQN